MAQQTVTLGKGADQGFTEQTAQKTDLKLHTDSYNQISRDQEEDRRKLRH